jgi:hypothetical protein
MFDNLRLSFQLLGEIKLSLTEQYYSEEKVIRIQGAPNQYDFIEINHQDPETGEILNDITASQADFVVDSQNYTATMRQAAFEQLVSMIEKLPPELAINLVDLVVDMSDVPMKETLVQRIRDITGQKDPSKAPDDPEIVAEEQAKAEQQAQEQQLLEAVQMLEMRLKEAQARKLEAEATDKEARISPEIDKTKAETMSIETSVELAGDELEFKREDAAIGRQLERAKILVDLEKTKQRPGAKNVEKEKA